MEDQFKSKVIGAFAVGIAIVGGAYTVSHFGQSSYVRPAVTDSQAALITTAPVRIAIPVKDSNNDGIEDWRESFVDNGSSVIIPTTSSSTYTVPDTLTDQLGVNFTQNIIRSKAYAGIGKTQEQVINDTVKQVSNYAEDKIMGVRDIIITKDSSPASIHEYANSMASAILGNNANDIKENELVILRDAVDSRDPAQIEKLNILTKVYEKTMSDSLAIPVPELLIKEHLDLINVYKAIYNDLAAMSRALDDPLLSLVRLKRYEEDAKGLSLSLQNLYLAFEPYAAQFKAEDPALFFVIFSPDYQ